MATTADGSINTPPDNSPHIHLTQEWEMMMRQNLLLRWFNKLIGLTSLSVRRLLYQPELSLLALLGIVLAVGLITSAGFFAQAVDQVILQREMDEYTRITGRPPFAARVFVASSRTLPLSLERAEALGQNVIGTTRSEVGLPVASLGFQVNSGVLKLELPPGRAPNPTTDETTSQNNRLSNPALSGTEQSDASDKPDEEENKPAFDLSRLTGASAKKRTQVDVNVLYFANVGEHMEILEGIPLDDSISSEGVLDVWLHILLAEKMGLQLGEELRLKASDSPQPLSIRVAGLWQMADPDIPFWLGNAEESMREKLLVRRTDYINFIEPLLDIKVRAVTWNVVLDESRVIPAKARDYVEGFTLAKAVMAKYLPNVQVTTADVSLGKFVLRQTTLTTLLLGFNVPGLGFLLYFLILTSAVIAYWQRRETTVLIRRGMNRLEILNFTLVETLALFVLGCPVGLAFGMLLARLMGYTTSFRGGSF